MINLKSANILIVDDEEQLRLLLRERFEAEGATVFDSESAAKAIEQLDTKKIDVIVSDLKMKSDDGIDVLNAISNRRDAPIFFLCSGYIHRDFSELKALGVHEIYHKPIDEEALIQSVVLALTQRRERGSAAE